MNSCVHGSDRIRLIRSHPVPNLTPPQWSCQSAQMETCPCDPLQPAPLFRAYPTRSASPTLLLPLSSTMTASPPEVAWAAATAISLFV
ncbi:hypothetical protein L596_020105 [Steinernema carpocapsae]|uniref:Uncharacterized protein n=1 Tax=Steinernema carpocapsae TaxID=34508 RepID=A0A4U5MTC7_STECR|nr:hypothetical protein L596_020105 [Steinernema carpocapsae]